MKIHNHFIYKKHPERYPQQHDERACWLFTIKAVIESYYPELNQNPLQYATSRLHRLVRISTPGLLSKTLRKYNISHVKGKYHKKSMLPQIDFFKRHLEDGPIVIVISHAYTKGNMFSIKRYILDQHYISIRGYDDEKEIFYCYDSHTTMRENDLPVGNLKLHYEDLVTYRDIACLGLFRKRFIAIKWLTKLPE
jgi:hypothetical protein